MQISYLAEWKVINIDLPQYGSSKFMLWETSLLITFAVSVCYEKNEFFLYGKFVLFLA
jgi:hypothetical protein